jgi:hypothetical protein
MVMSVSSVSTSVRGATLKLEPVRLIIEGLRPNSIARHFNRPKCRSVSSDSVE